MGQQQLLLIVLGVLIVGMAIYGGLRVMDNINESSDRDQLIGQMQYVIAEARKFAAKPTYLGGGDGTLTQFTAPQGIAITNRFRIYASPTEAALTLIGFGTVTGNDRENPVNVVMTFTLNDGQIQTETIN
ncbi:MAG: hypothetical protein MUE68_06925 [Bacteroidetes bacterium]|jgi:hypothetical protein|nr:hypothetical protein [Bacteroidota bacterium]